MLKVFQTEFIKMKRTFIIWLTAIIPIFCATMVIYISRSVVAPGVSKWDIVISQMFNWWPAVFLPLVTALFCSMVNSQEKKAGNYRTLRIHNLPPSNIWIGKIFIVGFYIFITSAMFLITTIIVGNLLIGWGQTPLIKVISASVVIFITSLAIIPIQLFFSTWKGMALSMIVGTLGLILEVIADSTKFWFLIPWSVPVRLMCPIVRTNPNGTYITDSASKLLDKSVIPVGIISSLCIFAIFTALTSIWFNKREVK